MAYSKTKNTENHDLIVELLEKGYSNNDIVKMAKCSLRTVGLYRENLKIPFSRKNMSEKKVRERHEKYIQAWLDGTQTGGRPGGYGKVSNHIRQYIFELYNNSCSECGWSKENTFTKTIPLEIEHIDGNPENHRPENLTLLCPNCHSLTAGHSTKKGNGRRYYREHYLKK